METPEVDVRALQARVERLERQNLRLRIVGGVGMALLLFAAASRVWAVPGTFYQVSRAFMAEHFVLVEGAGVERFPSGPVRASLAYDAVAPQGVTFQLRGAEHTQVDLSVTEWEALWNLHHQGRRAALGIGPDGHQALIFRDQSGRNSIALGLRADGTPYFDVVQDGRPVPGPLQRP